MMRILYGVQGTGNGHIARSRAMAKAFSRIPDIEVDWLFSGRSPDAFFDMACFGNYRWRRGLTFATRAGRIRPLETVLRAHPLRLYRDTHQLPLDDYDLVVSDFEPVTAWAARLQGKRSIGIGHQYAFGRDIPVSGDNPLARGIMRWYAPVDLPVGLHWSSFGQAILPPIIDGEELHGETRRDDRVLVYLPFEDPAMIARLLAPLWQYQFYIYHPDMPLEDRDNLHFRPPSTTAFRQDLARCRAVISNAGFELISEALTLGKRILVKPLAGQMEQHSNATALRQLGLATAVDTLQTETLATWLWQANPCPPIHYPDVAACLAYWIAEGCREPVSQLAEQLWSVCGPGQDRPTNPPLAA